MRLWLGAVVVAAGCGTDRVPEYDEPTPSEYVELRVPAAEVPPGAERLYCHYVDNEVDIAIDHTLGVQGPSGHHLALKGSTVRRPHGTFEDCTSGEANRALHDLHFGGNLPEDGALLIPAGAQLVVQTHHVNSTDAPLLVDDVLRLHRHTVTERTRWMSALHLADDAVVVPPGRSIRTFECAPTVETTLVMLWGHMHEIGARFTIAAGGQVVYEREWEPAFAANPPRLVPDATPITFRSDVPLTITCEWNNPSTSAIAFPSEMCGVGGYVLGNVPFWCAP